MVTTRKYAWLALVSATICFLVVAAVLAHLGQLVVGAQAVEDALTLGAEVSTPHAAAGETLVYTITLGNTTTATSLTVTMTDTLPVDLTLLTDSVWSSQGTAYATTDTVTWTGQLAPSTTVTVGLAAATNRSNTVVTNTVIADAGPFGQRVSSPLVTVIDPWRTLLPVVLNDWQACMVDDFSIPESGWPTGATSVWTLAYMPEGYTMRATQAPALLGVTRGDRVYHERFDYEVHVRSTSEGSGTVGLVYRINGNWATFYTFEINPAEQTYALFYYNEGHWYSQKTGQLSAIARSDTNTLRVEWIASYPWFEYPTAEYALYINGVRIYGNYYRQDTNPAPYGFGLIVTGLTEGYTAIVEEYRLLPEGCGLENAPGRNAVVVMSEVPEGVYTAGEETTRPPLVVLSVDGSGD